MAAKYALALYFYSINDEIPWLKKEIEVYNHL